MKAIQKMNYICQSAKTEISNSDTDYNEKVKTTSVKTTDTRLL